MATRAETAKHLDLSVRAVTDLIGRGVIPSRATLDQARIAYIRSLRETAAGRAPSGPLDPQQAKARLDHVRAEREELRLAAERRELVPAKDITDDVTLLVVTARNALLGLPSKLAATCAGQPAPAIFEEAMRVVRRTLTDLATDADAALKRAANDRRNHDAR